MWRVAERPPSWRLEELPGRRTEGNRGTGRVVGLLSTILLQSRKKIHDPPTPDPPVLIRTMCHVRPSKNRPKQQTFRM